MARVVCSPRHILATGGLKPGIIPIEHIKRSGVSLIRVDRVDCAELTKQAEAVARSLDGQTHIGVLVTSASLIREVKVAGRRGLCLVDDPVIDDEKIPDNPAHAIAVASTLWEEHEILEMRKVLLNLFSMLRQPAALY
jgi:hypothetical protein